ncbi:molybdopterin molybdochelatase [Trinickia symbiotica]|uniref:Molybdopterin molybdenumtransferase n=1 Tax=Trinickia symbiotica TaxID=863227 RepID=A0A2N7X229_9BURK|nr:gephyrin-like molybdotransferase Glp [Trinickia symbiotica]PMS35660.1 molybdopterin molybdenumtransferase MoeA [Trinickia symbiotica]PPK47731.1 molybdopterin molybdochelatase [Trinickia symbiotica]
MTTSDNISSFISEHDAQALPVGAAQAVVRRWAEPVATAERVALRAALGRVLAEDVVSPIDVPAHDNAAMDGYAFDGAIVDEAAAGAPGASGAKPDEGAQGADGAAPAAAQQLTLEVAGQALAGHPFAGALAARQCVRIMTGAPMPSGCDTVVPQEWVTVSGKRVAFDRHRIARGANRRRAGEDLARGQPALRAGRIIRSSDVGLLASLGIAEVSVRRRLRVAFFSTGDELRSIGEPLAAGTVYDSNRYTIAAMLARLGVDALDLGIVRDEPAALEAAFRCAAQSADVVLSSGGVSVGEADFTRRMFEQLGDVAFWHLAMRPGRPLAFGRLWPNGASGRQSGERPALFFGLPGNPVAVMATFYQIVREALLCMSGAEAAAPLTLAAAAAVTMKKRAGRTEYLRGIASRGADGAWRVTPTRTQSSGALSSMSEANCFIVLAHERGDVIAGELVDIMPFEGLI